MAIVCRPAFAAAQTVTFDDRPSLRFGRAFRVDFTAKLQGDVRESSLSDGSDDQMDFTRRRVGVKGTVGSRVRFEVDASSTAIGPGGTPTSTSSSQARFRYERGSSRCRSASRR
jgi:hypothetical protein